MLDYLTDTVRLYIRKFQLRKLPTFFKQLIFELLSVGFS
jgi:hypothetical protein